MFSSFGFMPLALAFSLILTVALRVLHSYSTDDKTSRLMVIKFSIVSNTLRGSQSYMEKREEGDRGGQEEMRGKSKGERTI